MVYKTGFPPWGKHPDLFPAAVPPRIPFLPSFPITAAGFSAYQKHPNVDVSVTTVSHGSTATADLHTKNPQRSFWAMRHISGDKHQRGQPLARTKVATEHSCPPAAMICTYCFITAFRSHPATHHRGKILLSIHKTSGSSPPHHTYLFLIARQGLPPPPHRKPALYFAESFIQLEISPLRYYQICTKLSCP